MDSACGTGLTTLQMKDVGTLSGAGWDIQTSATGRNEGYPYLSREIGQSSPTRYIYPYTYLQLYMNANGVTASGGLLWSYRIELANGGTGLSDAIVRLSGNLWLTGITLSGSTPAISTIVTGSYVERTGVSLAASSGRQFDLFINHIATGVQVLTASISTPSATEYDTGNDVFTVMPTVDYYAPGMPTIFTGTASGSDVLLSRTNPSDLDFASVTIRRSTSTYPATISEGTLVVANFTGETYTETSLSDAIYFYSIFAKDQDALYSTGLT